MIKKTNSPHYCRKNDMEPSEKNVHICVCVFCTILYVCYLQSDTYTTYDTAFRLLKGEVSRKFDVISKPKIVCLTTETKNNCLVLL